MLKCLFWNQGRKDVTSAVVTAADIYQLDLLAFCEVGAGSQKTLTALNELGDRGQYKFFSGRIYQRFHLFVRRPAELRLWDEADRFVIFEVRQPGYEPFILMVLHAPSKAAGWLSSSGSALQSAKYISSLRTVESVSGIQKSVVAGDFNMSPFEPGMSCASAFNAVMDARLAEKGGRKVQGQFYRYLYNPMWNLYGDRTPGPPATHFYSSSTEEELHWHMFDQVLASPEMVAGLKPDAIQIIESIGNHHLATNAGRPKRSRYSDHFPLYFELDI